MVWCLFLLICSSDTDDWRD
ncbi:hypothetical protein NFI96_010246 [Prochilodus magdalenae]|nr:hypothetical protein NFI96_010246 [Prochilodus magdalenae]